VIIDITSWNEIPRGTRMREVTAEQAAAYDGVVYRYTGHGIGGNASRPWVVHRVVVSGDTGAELPPETEPRL
jgi:hypothetical protein